MRRFPPSIAQSLASLAAAGLFAIGCFSPGVVAQRACHGRVVAAGSGAPLAGAEVFEVRSLSRWIHLDSADVAARWTTSDAAGRFAFACELATAMPRAFVSATGPHYEVFHPDTGFGAPVVEREDGALRLVVAPAAGASREDALRCPAGALPEHCRRRCIVSLGPRPECAALRRDLASARPGGAS